MASVSQFQKYLLLIEPKKDPGLFALYNYLKNYLNPDDDFSEKVINDFFLRSLRFEFWRNNKGQLYQPVYDALKSFVDQSHNHIFLKEVINLKRLQLVEIADQQDLLDTLNLHLVQSCNSNNKKSISLRVVAPGRVLSVQIIGDNEISVKVFTPIFYVQKGQLIPIFPATSLIYNGQVELHKERTQELEVSPHHFSRFHFENKLWFGSIIRGYTHQNFNDFKCSQLLDQFDIARKIKSLESYFVDVKSDPDYQQLIQLIEKTVDVVDQGLPHSDDIARVNLKKGQIALKNLFPNDKQLRLLLTSLEYSLLKRTGNSWQNPKSEQRLQDPQI